MTTYVLDLETRLLASDVEAEFAAELAGESPWSRPDLFGFAAGVAVELDTGEALRFAPDEAAAMIEALAAADVTAGYNSAAFDLGVLSGVGSVEHLRERHVDLCAAVWDALKDLAAAEGINHRLRQGGLDGLCKANGLAGKTGVGADAPAMFREGRIEELLTYCEADVRLTADLYHIAREHGTLTVEPTYRDASKNRVELGRRRPGLSGPGQYEVVQSALGESGAFLCKPGSAE